MTKESQNLINALSKDYLDKDNQSKEYKKELNELTKKLNAKAKEIKKAEKFAYNQELRQEYREMYNKWQEINNKVKSLSDEKIDLVSKYLNFKNGGIINLGKTTETTKAVALQLQKDLKNVIHKDLIKDIKIDVGYTKDKRNYFSLDENKMFVNKESKRSTAIHEAMHWLEHNNKEVGKKALEFLEYRTKGEEAIKLKNLVPNSTYKNNEIAKKDSFFSPYCGKIYSSGGSEILSMGVQEIFENAIEFSNKDPEYFNFVLDVIQKRI